MADAHALGACGLGRVGSSPTSPTRIACPACDTRLVTGLGKGAMMRVKWVDSCPIGTRSGREAQLETAARAIQMSMRRSLKRPWI